MNEGNSILKRVADSIITVQKTLEIAKYFELAKKDFSRIEDQGVVAQILNNMKQIMDSDDGQVIATSQNYGPFVPEFWPVVTAWYPEFPLKELISVQSMDKPLAYLFFTNLLTGTAKSTTGVGEIVETATGKRILKGKYPTGEITGEQLVLSDFEFDSSDKESIGVLAYYPLRNTGDDISKYLLTLGSTDTNLNGVSVVASAVGDTISFAKAASLSTITATMSISTGQLTIKESGSATGTTVNTCSVNYVWNIESADQTQVPTIVESITMLPMQAIPRALAMKWTIFSEYVKKAQFGADIRTATTKRILDLLYFYQCRYILDQMYDYATGSGSPVTITLPASTNITVESKIQTVLAQLNAVGNTIAQNVGRMQGNRIVCGNALKTFLESFPENIFIRETAGQGYVAPRKIGKVGNYLVYWDPDRADAEAFMTYRGDEWCDATYYLGEFMPMIPTDAVTLGVNVRAAFCSMEAYKYHKPNGTVKLAIAQG